MPHSLIWKTAYSFEKLRKDQIESARNQLVVKSNSLVQRSRFALSSTEQNIILFLISKIQPDDTGLEPYRFSFREFCDVCGIDYNSGSLYEHLRGTLKNLSDKSIWIDCEMDYDGRHYVGQSLVRWINDIDGSQKATAFWIRFHKKMLPYLFQLRRDFTQYQLRNVLALKSTYASALYELLKRFEYLDKPIDFSIDEIKNELGADDVPSYSKYDNFKRKVIETACSEINTYTDLTVEYLPVKTGRKVTRIIFAYRRKNSDEMIESLKKQEQRFGRVLHI